MRESTVDRALAASTAATRPPSPRTPERRSASVRDSGVTASGANSVVILSPAAPGSPCCLLASGFEADRRQRRLGFAPQPLGERPGVLLARERRRLAGPKRRIIARPALLPMGAQGGDGADCKREGRRGVV